MASSGLNLVSAILGYVSTLVDDDLELHFLGSVGNDTGNEDYQPLNEGRYEIVRRDEEDLDNPNKNNIVVSFSIHRFAPLAKLKDSKVVRNVTIVLKSIDLKLNVGDQNKYFLFESNLGSGKEAMKFDFETKLKNNKAIIENVMGIKNKILYKGNWNVGVPFAFNLSFIKEDKTEELKALKGVIESAEKTASEVAAFKATLNMAKAVTSSELGAVAKAKVNEAVIKSLIANSTKAAESFRSVYAEFISKETKSSKLTGLITASSTIEGTGLEKLDNFITVDSVGEWKELPLTLKIDKKREAVLTLGVLVTEKEIEEEKA